jgi:hypothetical protein
MPSNILDPIITVANAVVALMASDSALSGYNWQGWESDADVVLPRGYVNVEASTPLVDETAPMQFEIEIVFEGKPKKLSPSVAIAEALGQVNRVDLATALESKMVDTSVTFMNRQAESVRVRQQVIGDLRRRTISFTLFGHWNVAWSPS